MYPTPDTQMPAQAIPPITALNANTADADDDSSLAQDHQDYAQAAEAVFDSDTPKEADAKMPDLSALSQVLLREFTQAKQDRMETELRWLMDLRQYRGIYEPEVVAELTGRSQTFVRKTRVKVKTMDSRVADLTFPIGSDKNWSIEATPDPQIDPAEKNKIIAQLTQQNQGTQPSQDQIDQAVMAQAKDAAKRHAKVIEDELVETRYKQVCKAVQHSGHLYGTGILKGPLVEKKVRTRFVQQGGKWITKPEEYLAPFMEQTSIWRWYPDMSATELANCRYVYELHRMTAADMYGLAERKTFNGDAIKDYVQALSNGQVENLHFESDLKSLGDRASKQGSFDGQYDVIERWGWLKGDELQGAGVTVPADRLCEVFFSNVWMLPNGTVIKAVLSPIDGVTWPYHLYHFDKDETSIFGEGIPAIMRDDQTNLNASVRMMLDNGGITAGPMIEIDYSLLSPSSKAQEIGPWKIWARNGNSPGQRAVNPIVVPNSLEWLHPLAEMFDNSADETTAIPRYQSGMNETNGAAGTARGMSMLMGAANVVTKDQVSTWDEDVVVSFLTSLYRWNMKFHRDPAIKGDFDVKVKGSASMVAKEVRGQALDQFAAQTNNPQDAPYIKRDVLLRERAATLELSGIVKDEEEVLADQNSPQNQQMQQLQQQLQQAQLGEAQGRAAKLQAESEVLKKKLDEMLANINLTTANIDLLVEKKVATRVETVFAALQAGGVATNSPYTAPAGDEILRSAGFVDLTPNPTLAQLDGPPVQAQQGTHQLMAKGATFQVQPRGDDPGQPPQDPAQGPAQDSAQGQGPSAPPASDPANALVIPGHTQPGDAAAGVGQPAATTPPGPGPASGAVNLPDANTGQRAGIETPRIEQR